MLREINNIYVPTTEEYAALGKIVDNNEKMYDYIVAKAFEYDLWSVYQTDKFNEVPINMYDGFIFESDKVVREEMTKALVKMYPEIVLDKLPLGEENRALALYEMIQNDDKRKIAKMNFQTPFGKEFSEVIRCQLELSPRYRFEYRRYDADARLGIDNQIDFIFEGKIASQNIKNVQTLQNLLYIDPIYIVKISDEEYLRIYADSKTPEEDVLRLKNRDAILAIDSFVNRYRFVPNIWSRNYSERLNNKEYAERSKKLIRVK